MPVTSVTTDRESRTLAVDIELPVPAARAWEAFADPRQLERFWGPPGWPASIGGFEFREGGLAHYAMTGPNGERAGGRWEFTRIDDGASFDVIDTFENEDGTPNTELPATEMTATFEDAPGGSRLRFVSRFPTVAAFDQLAAMGMVEGITLAMNQLDGVVLGARALAEGRPAHLEILDDTHVRITRLFEASRDAVWHAHMDGETTKRWMLGPDGWSMPVAEEATEAGQSYRNVWVPDPGTEGEEFGFEGEALLVDAPRRAVTTQRMIGVPGPGAVNDLQLHEEDGATLLTIVIEYPDVEMRDMVIDTGMVEGMEDSYRRLESVVLG